MAGRPKKYICDKRGRQLIIELYDGSKARTDELALRLGVSNRIVTRWAKEIAKYGFNWSEAEEEFLKENFHKMSSSDIARHLGRTVDAVRGKIQRMRLYLADRRNGYTMLDLMMGFGISDHGKVQRWIDLGWLKGRKISINGEAARQHRWCFSDNAIRDFIKNHPDQLDPKKFDWPWIHDLCFGGSVGISRLDADSYGERTS